MHTLPIRSPFESNDLGFRTTTHADMSRDLSGAGLSALCIGTIVLASSLFGVPFSDGGVDSGIGDGGTTGSQSSGGTGGIGTADGVRTPGSGTGGGSQSGSEGAARRSLGQGVGQGPESGSGPGSEPGPGPGPGPEGGGSSCVDAVQTAGQNQRQDAPVQYTPARDRVIPTPTPESAESDRCRTASDRSSTEPSLEGDGNSSTAGQSAGRGAERDRTAGAGDGSSGSGTNASARGRNGTVSGSATQASGSAATQTGQQSGQSASRSQQSIIGPSRGNSTALGGPLSRGDPQVQFVVDADTAAYWRTRAYDRYTGTEWQRTVEDRPAPEPSVDGDRFSHEIIAKQPLSTRTLPTAWRPQRLVDGGAYGRVTDDGRLVSTQSVGTNESYTVASRLPMSTAATLRRAGGTDPPVLAQHYTQLPAGTPSRVGVLTDSLTSDAETRYETAAQIERWLEANKNYSLEARDAPSNFVDTFLFEMERGYCQYFAAAMVVMLRTQDVPARYVTGYSPGQEADDGTFVVRQMNAHAWVEVYFPGEGWVQFDPTPPSARTNSEGQALSDARTRGSAGVDTEASRGESYSPPSQGSPSESAGSGSRSGGGDSEQNGRQAGGDTQQEQQGQSGNSGRQNQQGGQRQRGQRGNSGERTSDSDDEQGQGSQGSSGDQGTDEPPQQNGTENNDTGDGSAPAYNISVDGDRIPGRNVTVTVTRGGSPQSGVTVRFNNESVGLTDADGQLRAQVPFEETLFVEIEPPAENSQPTGSPAQRGATNLAGSGALSAAFAGGGGVVTGGSPATESSQQGADGTNRTVRLDVDTELRVVAPETPTPDQSISVRAEIEQFPITEAAVSVDGRFVGLTDGSGNITVDVPYADQVNVTAQRGEARASTTIRPRRLNVSVTGERTPGNELRITATVGNATVPNATVRLDGDRVGQTNASGSASFTVPFRPDVVVGVTRGASTTNRTVDLPDELTVTTSGVVAPGLSVETTVTVDGEPVPNATVRGDGELLGTTGGGGVLEVTVPVQNAYELRVSRGELRGSTTVPWILLLPGLVVLGLVTLVGLTLSSRYLDVGPSPAAFVARVRRSTARTLRRVVSSVVGAVAYVASLLDRLEGYCRHLVSDTVATLRATPSRIASWLGQRKRRIRAWLRAYWASLRGVLTRYYDAVRETGPREFLSRLVSALRGRVQSLGSVTSGTRGEATQGTAATATDDDEQIDIQDAWRELTARVPVSNPEATTPVQYGERAVDHGLPAEAVETLTELYRKAEYSYWDPTSVDERQAHDALRTITRELDQDRSQGGTADD